VVPSGLEIPARKAATKASILAGLVLPSPSRDRSQNLSGSHRCRRQCPVLASPCRIEWS
jgi:hypothetical protein